MNRLLSACACAALLACAGCEKKWNQSPESSMGSALPPVTHPVGPVPGAGDMAQPGNPYEGDLLAQRAGRETFVRFNCSGCHGGRAGGGMGPSLRDVDWIYGSTDAQIFDSIAEGRAHGMPAWGTKLPEDQVWKLVAYIKSLRTPDEPHPPS